MRVHFCNQCTLHPDSVLCLDGQNIPVVEKVKFSGVFLDKKLNIRAHIDYLQTKCFKAMNLLIVVAGFTWGANQRVSSPAFLRFGLILV